MATERASARTVKIKNSAAEALDHQDGGEDHHAEQREHIGDDEQRIENIQERGIGFDMLEDKVVRADNEREQHQRAEQRGHQTARGAEFMFDQFSQHLNTSRKSASTDWLRVSRISSQLSCRLIFP